MDKSDAGITVTRRSANAALVGAEDARRRLSTPALVLDLDAFEANVEAMARWAREHLLALRPHAKTHKCTEIARRQIAAGAVGVCCATIAEAEAMVAGGIPGVLITSPLTTTAKIERLVRLRERARGLMVVVESQRNLQQLAAAWRADGPGEPLGVLVDVDIGHHRTGVVEVVETVALARAAASTDGVAFRGVQAYAGHVQHVGSAGARRLQSFQALERLRVVLGELRAAGLPPQIVSGAGTGTAWLDVDVQLFNEMQVGSYAVMDVEYAALQWPDGGCPFRHALFVATAVVSTRQPDRVVVDGGSKAFATDGPLPRLAAELADATLAEIELRRMGDEHLAVGAPAEVLGVAEGDLVEFVVPHCDPTINLYDFIHVFRGDRLVDVWPVDARGHG